MTGHFPRLFEPVTIRHTVIRNRIAMCAMNDNLALPDGYPTQHQIDYYAARAAGGVGLLITGNAFIDDDVSKISSNQLGACDNRMGAGLARLTEAVQDYGAALVVQLAHAGTQVLPETICFRQTVGPSALLWQDVPRELTVLEIQKIVTAFAAAAARVERAGAAGVEIHCGHGYLLSAFLSPQANRRTDGYGGSVENRMRIVREIFDQTRAATGSRFIVGAKFNASDLVDGGVTFDEGLLFAKALEAAGADYLGVSRGVGDSVDKMIAPLYYPRHENISAARRIRDAVGTPVIAMGSVHDPGDAEEIIERGDADMVAVGRSLLADPGWPDKARRGDAESIRPCIRCNECVALVDENREVRCAVNPFAGREAIRLESARPPRRVLVLGGGPAGCEAALTAGARGHQVTLIERRDRLGGASVPAHNPEFKLELERLPAWYARQLARAGADVILGQESTVESVAALEPDVIVFAIGAEPVGIDVPGADDERVMHAIDLLQTQQGTGQDIVVVGAGFVGCETAVHLGRIGNRVRLLTRRKADDIATDLNYTVRLALRRLMEDAAVEIVAQCDVREIRPGTVLAAQGAVEPVSLLELPADRVVLARGFTPSRGFADTLRVLGFDVRTVGDAAGVGLIYGAVHQGFAVGSAVLWATASRIVPDWQEEGCGRIKWIGPVGALTRWKVLLTDCADATADLLANKNRMSRVPEYIVTKLDMVEQLLIRSIVSGEIAPGEPLRQLELADRLGISATPVREALRRLEAQGLVVRHPHRGVRVAEVEPGEMSELYIIRAALEGLAVEHAVPHLSAKDIRALEQIHERLEAGRAKGALKSLRKLNYDFHTTLYQHSELPRLIRIIDSLWPLFPWDSIWAIPGRAASSAVEHREILDALREGDAVAAGSAMRRHIESGAEELIKFHANADHSSGRASGRRSTKRSVTAGGDTRTGHGPVSDGPEESPRPRSARTAGTGRGPTTTRLRKADLAADVSDGAEPEQGPGGHGRGSGPLQPQADG